MLRLRTVLILVFAATAASGQGPSAAWRTVTTPHFRVHYPAAYEAWATRAASRLESERKAVASETGYTPGQTTDVLVMNPFAEANGITLALLDSPRIILYAEPPPAESQLGEFGNWIDLLTVHEVTHLVHLLRPSRNPGQRLLARVLPLNPIALRSPRWVLEGYATVVEGRLTGSGRPASAIRAAVLRRFAQSGRLPTYAQLNSSQTFLGMSMAYLMGSAFLEWLEARTGPESLRHLWARMTARENRDFAQAFEGVFGDRPDRRYGEFVAELTGGAMTVARLEIGEGELWEETPRGSGEPAVSPDGKEIAVVVRAQNKPARIVIWKTDQDLAGEKRYAERIAKMLARDPQDVAPVRNKPLPRQSAHTFVARDGGDLESPRWTRDGHAILYGHRQPDRDGFLHHDLFLWWPGTGEERRITRGADVSQADLLADGEHAIAVRNRFGLSQLVLVDLRSGEVSPFTEPALESVYSHPRISSDGKRVAFSQHADGSWRLVVRDLQSNDELIRSAGPGTNVGTAEWSRTEPDTLYAAVFAHGFIDIQRFAGSSPPSPVTQTTGAAWMPAPAPDGRLFFMSLERDGFVVRVLGPAGSERNDRLTAGGRGTTNPTVVTAPAALDVGQVTAPASYGVGRQEWRALAGGVWARAGKTTEVGMRVGDVVGRLDTIVMAGFGSGPRGAAIAASWRGWPVVVSAHGFDASRTDAPRKGVELRGSFRDVWHLSTLRVEAGILAGTKQRVFAESSFQTRQLRGLIRSDESLTIAGDRSGRSSHGRVLASGSLRLAPLRFGVTYQRDAATRGHDEFDELAVGGVRTSITPSSALTTRILDPALAFRALTGVRYEGRRVEAGYGMVTAFWQQHHAGGERLSLAGLMLTLHSEAVPLVKLPGLELNVGGARTRTRNRRSSLWMGLRWTP